MKSWHEQSIVHDKDPDTPCIVCDKLPMSVSMLWNALELQQYTPQTDRQLTNWGMVCCTSAVADSQTNIANNPAISRISK